VMLRGRRYRLLNHVHGLPYDPPRWGEQPRLRSKATLRQGAGTTVAVLDSGASEHEWLRGSFAEDPLPDSAREFWDLSTDALPRQVGHGRSSAASSCSTRRRPGCCPAGSST
jgi:hypothetical protein